MSLLKKPYELSVWVDEWSIEQNKFIEKRIAIIGTDQMQGQLRAIEPNLIRNVNGTKKLTFKMYRQYTDTTTGEKIDNPFCQFLVNERKVKLKYKNNWYDFIVKNITESSSGKLCTYSLEDALVQELSKNGFNKTLDAELMNNIGTAKELAEYVLQETDWQVESETFVQTVEEPLVYVVIPGGTRVVKLKNSHADYLQNGLVKEDITLNNSINALAFYSSCRNKPHRFQFMYTNSEFETDAEKRIINKDNQYFIEVEGTEYGSEDTTYGFALPNGVVLRTLTEDSTISTKYRGNRYGFAQISEYSPLLGKYVSKYKKGDDIYYGYVENEYSPPVLTTNLVSNTEFKNSSGWTGASFSGARAKIDTVFGYFNNFGSFIPALEVLATPGAVANCKPYLKITFDSNFNNQIVLNSGPYDNRTLIGNMPIGSKWALKSTVIKGPGTTGDLSFTLGEYDYYTSSGTHSLKNDGMKFSYNGISCTVQSTPHVSENQFKNNSKLKIAIQASGAGEYYIESISLFREKYYNGNLIEPDDQNLENISSGVITQNYYYFKKEELNKTSAEDIEYELITETPSLLYEKVYNEKGEKINTVSAKESNYFNILQSIAETFECWLDLIVTRDDDGAILSKTAKFKNYAGGDNYAAFRYGVNLVDIQRTHESRNIVTKLIVKQNSNQYANNGFCTIARATSNETGENYIYDFAYYQNNGLMSASDYVNTLYKLDGAIGKDVSASDTSYNLNGYFPRLRAINDKIILENERLSGITVELVNYKAKYDVASAALAAALSGAEEVTKDLLTLTKFATIEQVIGLDDKSSEVEKYLQEYAVYKQTELAETENKATWENRKNQKQNEYDSLWENLEEYYEQKEALNKLFYERYSRFIQEGTWISEDYVDDEKYYIDAKSVMYNSCFPQVSYTINTLSVSQLPGYEMFNFELGDKTYAEDGDLFGYNTDGSPKREEVIISEISENLDDPTKNTNKVQNFKNQFQDLFQKITATTQQAQYNSGTYAQGAALAKAINDNKSGFLNDALGEMTVNLTRNPVVESTSLDGSSAIKIIDGKVLFSTEDDSGDKTWTVGLSSAGISANKITAGQLNTGEIQIMSGNDPTFRWDEKGITSYDYDTYANVSSNIQKSKFVRFDRYGLYGVNKAGVQGDQFAPNDQQTIDKNSSFSLTWDGLALTPQNLVFTNDNQISGISPDSYTAKIGRVDDRIYNSWSKTGIPEFESSNATNKKFVKVMAVGDKVGEHSNETFVLYSDGTLVAENIKLPGSIQWTSASSPSKSVYGADAYNRPLDGTGYNTFPDTDEASHTGKTWHKIYNVDVDTYYCHTDDGGATWQGPFILTGSNGTSPYTVELDNDVSVISMANGNPLGLPITISAKGYYGSDEANYGTWSLSAPKNKGWYELDINNIETDELNSNYCAFSPQTRTLKILGLPPDVSSGMFTFEWFVNDTNYVKTYSFTTTNSLVSWELSLDKNVINRNGNEDERTVTIWFQKTDSTGKTVFNGSNQIQPVRVQYSLGDKWLDLMSDTLTLSSEVQFRLIQSTAEGVIPELFVWDTETVSMVENGKGHITVQINCTTGTIYINNNITNAKLEARVYQDNIDITEEFPIGAFLWEKYDMDGIKVENWSYNNRLLPLSADDIYKRATFNCAVDITKRM